MTGETYAGPMAIDDLDSRVRQVVAEQARRVEDEMAAVIDRVCQSPPMRSGATYAALGGGKRLRPALTLLSARACGGDRDAALPAAAAVEFVHAFSLVHDDLPCMDDDDLRRGRPTLHLHAGEAAALLAGDAMLNAAYWTLTHRVPDHALAARLVMELADASGRMIDGQTLDTLGGFEPTTMDRADQLRKIHEWKTGALMRAACRMGAICAGADDGALKAITRYAEAVGLMFQILDDLIDVEQSTEQAGKRTGKDADAGKLTFPGVLGVEASKTEVVNLLEAALAAIEPLGPPAADLADLAKVLASRTR